jgi:hypothetical protein
MSGWNAGYWNMFTPIERMRIVMSAIASAAPSISFADIIDSEREAFMGIEVAFAAHAHDSYIQQVRIDQIEQECALVCSLFCGFGLLFYSDRIYSDMQSAPAPIALDYSIGLDKNLCENIRRYVEGRSLDRPDDLHRLLQLVRGRSDKAFNYDFVAYLIEEYEHFFVPNNERPGNTVFALKVLDYLDADAIARFPASPVTPDIRLKAWKDTQESLSYLFANESLASLQVDQRAIYAVLLKGLVLKWQGLLAKPALAELARFSLDSLRKFAKREIYYAWKLMGGDGIDYPFFQPAVNPSKNSLSKLKGISWDLTMLHWAQIMSGAQRISKPGIPDFFIPFVASNDKKFREMVAACPLKAIILDRKNKIVNMVFRDELAYQTILQEEMGKAGIYLGTAQDQARRLNAALNSGTIEHTIAGLEREANECAQMRVG